MSSIIPIVSSSPPPMDEDQTFGWDDDGDDFGNFASAPGFDSSTTREDNWRGDGFDAAWPASGFPSQTGSAGKCQTEESSVSTDSENMCAVDKSDPKHCIVQEKEEVASDVVADDNDFAEFAAFLDDTSSKSKPHIDSLALKATHQPRVDGEPDSENGVEKGMDPVMEKSRESTATDSGLFSTDMSPLPQSESVCISEGDKTMQSDDESLSDMPQDSQPHWSHNDPDQLPTHPDLGEEEHSQCENSQSSSDKISSRQSSGASSLDQNDQLKSVEVTEVIENEEVNDFDKEDNTDGSLWHNKLSGSTSLALKTGQVESHNQQDMSSVPGTEDSTSERNAGPQDCSSNSQGATDSFKDDTLSNSDLPSTLSLSNISYDKSLDASNEDNAGDDGAAFETSPSFLTQREQNRNGQEGEPEDLVLRKDSIHFEEEQDVSGASSEDANSTLSENDKSEKDLGEEGMREETQSCRDREGDDEQNQHEVSGDMIGSHSAKLEASSPHEHSGSVLSEADGELGQSIETATSASHESSQIPSSAIPPAQDSESSPVRRVTDLGTEEDSFGDFHGETIPPSEDKAAGKEKSEGFGNFSSSQEKSEVSDFGNFSSRQTTSVEDDDDDFGDFNARSPLSGAPVTKANRDDLGDHSSKSADTAGGGDGVDDFGDFSGQPAASSDSGWADFGKVSTSTTSDDDFASFSASNEPQPSSSIPDANTATVRGGLSSSVSSSTSQVTREKKMETALRSCFPWSEVSFGAGGEESGAEEESDVKSADKSKLGVLETILHYGLQFRSASQQTWQVVQHPSKKDPRVKLWGQLQDVDGSPAVIYQWGKSSTNSHLFHTLHIDTQNMLIGHKKRSVPIFATGLSLLEPIRGERKEREARGRTPPDPSTVLSPTLVDSSPPEAERHSQEIPAVDFDWSTSGLTNPLTSHSLDLDFLVAQDTQASDKPSVFQSEVLDAPRSSVKSSQPLEDILKSVKPTSVRSRRDEAATSQMSSEALRVLASLPDLAFMQSKVLMFPIKN